MAEVSAVDSIPFWVSTALWATLPYLVFPFLPLSRGSFLLELSLLSEVRCALAIIETQHQLLLAAFCYVRCLTGIFFSSLFSQISHPLEITHFTHHRKCSSLLHSLQTPNHLGPGNRGQSHCKMCICGESF